MQLPPMAVMATWPKPNYIDPHTRGHGVLIANAVWIPIAAIVTALRLYTRLRITATPGIDDLFIVIGLIFAIAMGVVISVATENWGFNRHIWDLPLEWIPTVQKFNMTFQITFSWASCFTKISLLWFCRRLLGRSKGNFRIYNWTFIVAMVIVVLSIIAFTLITIFQCSPVKAAWDVNPKYPHKCTDANAIVFAASIVNIFTDFLSTALPMPLIWRLKLPTRQRIAVTSILALGIMVNVAGSVRTVYVHKSMIESVDTTWVGWPILIAATVEINLGLICASAPALRPLVASFIPRFQSSRGRSDYDQYGPRSRSQKLWSSNGRSHNSRATPRGDTSQVSGYENDHFGIMRTVEMESWSESRLAHQAEIGHSYQYAIDDRAISPVSLGGKTEPWVFNRPVNSDSSDSLPREI